MEILCFQLYEMEVLGKILASVLKYPLSVIYINKKNINHQMPQTLEGTRVVVTLVG